MGKKRMFQLLLNQEMKKGQENDLKEEETHSTSSSPPSTFRTVLFTFGDGAGQDLSAVRAERSHSGGVFLHPPLGAQHAAPDGAPSSQICVKLFCLFFPALVLTLFLSRPAISLKLAKETLSSACGPEEGQSGPCESPSGLWSEFPSQGKPGGHRISNCVYGTASFVFGPSISLIASQRGRGRRDGRGRYPQQTAAVLETGRTQDRVLTPVILRIRSSMSRTPPLAVTVVLPSTETVGVAFSGKCVLIRGSSRMHGWSPLSKTLSVLIIVGPGGQRSQESGNEP
ncbi:hypothetical protein EYF80_032867 [Liparis tanakae]|uniref:Uncharacterized protein n=1 Tax=Liparis tanakae TaxID=230148 RepID=A0A4Z2GTF4_9TELE|nr:hypothetical protein EYF80_032867 [Liparis tanakae]